MNDSVFGKKMENLRKRIDVRLVTNEKKLDKLTSKPTFVSSKIFSENLMAVRKVKETSTLNRSAYVGMCILDVSKTLMYDFHYNYIKKKYNSRARLLFTNTDSLTYEIEAGDIYKDFWNDKDMLDNSNYPESSPSYCNVNKKIIGKFKDEACGIPITEFIGFNSFGTRMVFLNDPLSDEYDPTQWVSVSREVILHFLKNRVSATKCLFSCLQHKNIEKHSKDEI